MRKFTGWLLKIFGWKVADFVPSEKKYVIIVAPHTSFWDFIIGRLFCTYKGIPAKFFIKKEFFFFPIKGLLKALGGVPINRQNAKNVVAYTVKLLDESEDLVVIITPEGTRKKVENWKKGYYYIAERANVPLYPGFIDFKTKNCGMFDRQIPITGNYEQDFKEIEKIYRGMQGKHPERFNLYP